MVKHRSPAALKTFEDAQSLAMMLQGGALPVDLTIVEKQTTGPQLGADSIAQKY